MKVSVLALWSAALLLLVLVAKAPSAAEASHHGGAGLKLGYYKKTCPGVENVVKYHVAKAIKANRGAGAALVRLIFHDCFVRVRRAAPQLAHRLLYFVQCKSTYVP
jgi:peroxidase